MRKPFLALMPLALLVPLLWLPVDTGCCGPQPWHAIIARKNSGGGGCTTVEHEHAGTSSTTFKCANLNSRTHVAGKFTTGSGYTACLIQMTLTPIGSPTGTFSAHIYSHDSTDDDPLASLWIPSGTLDPSTLSAGENEVEFSGGSVTLDPATTYWVVLEKTSGAVSNVNHLEWTSQAVSDTGVVEIARIQTSTDDASDSWTDYRSGHDRQLKFKVKSE